jgi:UDP-glucuronate decarboxylase
MIRQNLIAGEAGFLGSHLCAHLLQQNCEEWCIDDYFADMHYNTEIILDHYTSEVTRYNVTAPLYSEVDKIDDRMSLTCPIRYHYDPVQPIETNVIDVLVIDNVPSLNRRPNVQAPTREIHDDPEVCSETRNYCEVVDLASSHACYELLNWSQQVGLRKSRAYTVGYFDGLLPRRSGAGNIVWRAAH